MNSIVREKKEKAGTDSSVKLEAIRAFADEGFCLIPLRGKLPVHLDWPNTAPREYGEKQLAGVNYGVALKAGDLVVDIDPRNFKPGDRPVVRLVEEIGPLSSFTVKTGGKDKGLHIYFSKPADLLTRSKLKAYPGIDFRSVGAQMVGPGSIHPDTGAPYGIVDGAIAGIQPAPEKLLELLKRTAPSWDDAAGTGEYKDDAATQARYKEYLREAAPASGSFIVACHGRDLALPPETTWKLMVEVWNERRNNPHTSENLKTKVIHAYTYAGGAVGSSHPAADFQKVKPAVEEEKQKLEWITDRNGHPTKCFYNLLSYMKMQEGGLYRVFGYNEFTLQSEFMSPAPWHRGRMPRCPAVSDHDLKLLKGYLAVKHSIEMPINVIDEAVANIANANRFHPVREYLESLKWDGTPRLETWLHDYCGAINTGYTRACARKTLVAAVMRIMRPGIKFDHVLVLEGEQDIGKSTICKILGGEWAADFPIDPHNRDTVQAMIGKWIIELAELEVTRRSESDALKAFLTRATDKVRLAYGRLATEFPRQSIFIASKNPGPDGTYLKDDTGNRRWWPVELKPRSGQVDFKGLKAARNQLWAEAMNRAKTKGEHLYMETGKLKAAAKDTVALRHAEHPWTERVAQWMEGQDKALEFITGREIYIFALDGIDKSFGRREAVAIAGIMRSFGWAPDIKRRGKRIVRGYAPSMDPKDKDGAEKTAKVDVVTEECPECDIGLELNGERCLGHRPNPVPNAKVDVLASIL